MLTSETGHMQEDPIRVAFLGGGVNSAVGGAHRAAIGMDRSFELVGGFFSEDESVNLESASRYGIQEEGPYRSLGALLEGRERDFEAVVILTPTPLHYNHVMRCLEAGIPVICEKTIGSSSSEVAAIRDRVLASGRFRAPIYNYTGYPMLRELRNQILCGKLGKLQQIHVEMPQEGFLRRDRSGGLPRPQEWRELDGEVPTLSLDLGVHLHHMVHFLSDERPLRALGVENRFGSVPNVVDNVMGFVEYSGDLVCNLWYGKTALGHRNGLRVRVYGDEGSAEWLQVEPETLVLNDRLGGRHLLDRSSAESEFASQDRYNRFKVGHPSGFIEAFANHYHDIAACYWSHRRCEPTDNPYVSSVDVALEGMYFLEALSLSSRKREWVGINP